MKHPALTRVFAIVLAVLCLVMLLAGVFGIRSALRDRISDRANQARLSGRIDDYELVSQALAGTISYKEAKEALDARQDQHDEDAAQHRIDLATYTATKGGITEGINALDEADAAYAAGKAQYEQGLKEFEKKEAAFWEGYRQFQEGQQQLADGWAQYNTLSSALTSAQGQLAGLKAIGDILADDSSDDAQALQSAAIAAYDGAISAFDSAMGVTDSMKSQGGITTEQLQMMMDLLEQETGIALAELPLEGVSAEQLQQLEDSIVAATGMTPDQIRSALAEQRDSLASGDAELLLTPEQFAAVREIYRQNRDLVVSAIGAVEGKLNELGATVEETGQQLSAAQAEMDKMAAFMEQGKAGIEQGRKALEEAGKQIEAGGAALYAGRAEIWYQMGKLEEKEKELQAEKASLDQESEELSAQEESAQQQKELEQRETSLRLMLLDRPEIEERVDAGTPLLDAAKAYLLQWTGETEHSFRGRLAAYILMLVGALAACLGIPAAFEKSKSRSLLIVPVLLALLCAAAVEAIVLSLGLRLSYSALAVAIFAAIQLLITVPKAKRNA